MRASGGAVGEEQGLLRCARGQRAGGRVEALKVWAVRLPLLCLGRVGVRSLIHHAFTSATASVVHRCDV